jgi:hypothetical protein
MPGRPLNTKDIKSILTKQRKNEKLEDMQTIKRLNGVINELIAVNEAGNISPESKNRNNILVYYYRGEINNYLNKKKKK